jgi:hypothetical protein
VGRARVLSINLLSGIARLRLENTGEVVELTTDELRNQFGTAVRPADLQEVVEAPIRERQAKLDRDFVAVLSPVQQRGGAAGEVSIDTTALEGFAEGEGDEGPIEEGAGGEEGARRRRRRGRRGGRRRRGEGASAEVGEVEGASEPGEVAPAD